MSSSELRYLITANELAEQMEIVKQADVANKLNVSKVSTYNAIERVYDDYTLYVGAFVAALRDD